MDVSLSDKLKAYAPESVPAFDWSAIIVFYCIYIGIMTVGGISGYHTNNIAAVLLIILLYVRYWKYLFQLKFSISVYCILLCLLLPVIPLISFEENTFIETKNDLIKYYALHFVILTGLSLPLTPISHARRSWLLYSFIFLFLLIGSFWPYAHGIHESRFKGFLSNPNNFALMAIMLLFLTNNEATRSVTNRTSHIIVISLILLSRTSGALLGYLAGFLHSKVLETKKYRLIRVTILLIAIFLIIALFAAIPRNTIEPIDKALKKIEAAEKNVNRILSGNKIDYYAMIESAGEDNTSGVWRLNQWNSILTLFVHSSLDKIFFGYGIGATRIFFMADAHNDYLRILFETGLVGLILNMTIWIILYRRMPLKFRSIVIMIAVFCITENNYDNFPAMSLLVFYMIGAGGAVCDHKNGTGFAVVNRLQAKRV